VIGFLASWAPAALWAMALFLLSHQSSVPGVASFLHADKVAHFVLFAVLGTTLAWAGRKKGRGKALVFLVLLGVAYAATDEWHQSFVPSRDPSYGDFLADTVGVVVGFVLTRLLLEKRKAVRTSRR